MPMTDERAERYLTDATRDSLAALAESHAGPELSDETVTELFVEECETFETLFRDDAPISAVRETALLQTKAKLRNLDEA